MENNSKGLVSIVLPIYNGEKYMRQSIESVINQTYKNWELIIIDECSSDNTPIIAKEYVEKDKRIRYYRNETNLKLPRGLNRGFSLSNGEYLTWTSDDNMFKPKAIEILIDRLLENKSDFVFSSFSKINDNEEIIERITWEENDVSLIPVMNIVGPCFLYTRTVYEEIGDYNPNLFLAEDYDYWRRIYYKYGATFVKDNLYLYRMHEGALTSTMRKKDFYRSLCTILLENKKLFSNYTLEMKCRYYETMYFGKKELNEHYLFYMIMYYIDMYVMSIKRKFKK